MSTFAGSICGPVHTHTWQMWLYSSPCCQTMVARRCHRPGVFLAFEKVQNSNLFLSAEDCFTRKCGDHHTQKRSSAGKAAALYPSKASQCTQLQATLKGYGSAGVSKPSSMLVVCLPVTVIRGCGTVLRKYLRNLGTPCQQHRRTGRNRSEPSEPFRRTPLQLKHRMGYMGPEISRPLWLGQRPLLEQATGYSNTCCTLCYAHLGCHTMSEPERRVTLPTRPDNRATRLEDGMYLTLSLACHEGFWQHHLGIALKAHLPPEKELLLACTGGP